MSNRGWDGRAKQVREAQKRERWGNRDGGATRERGVELGAYRRRNSKVKLTNEQLSQLAKTSNVKVTKCPPGFHMGTRISWLND